MPELTDISAIALVVIVLYMGERWANKLITRLAEHMQRQQDTLDACFSVLEDIQDSLQNPDKE